MQVILHQNHAWYLFYWLSDIETDDPVTDDAGDSFGGRKEKKKAKRNTKHDSDKELLAPILYFWINLWFWLLYFIRDRGGAMKPQHKICDFTTSR